MTWRVLLLAVGIFWPTLVVAADAAPLPVTATIRNAPGGEPLRCVVVLAHFVTMDLRAIAPGDEIAISLTRDAKTRTLIVTAPDGRRMALESLLCGATSAWAKTRGEVPLLPLRETAGGRVVFTCRIDRRLSCQAM